MALSTSIVDISPQRAGQILEQTEKLGGGNFRKLNARYVGVLVDDLEAGRWEDGSCIRLNGDGRCLDGQHRLVACVRSGVPLAGVVLVEGAETAACVDTGRQRSYSQYLANLGERNCAALAAGLRTLLMYRRGMFAMGVSRRISNGALDTLLAMEPGLRRSVAVGRRANRVVTGSFMAVVIHVGSGERRNEFPEVQRPTEEFVRQMSSGAGLDELSPVLGYRRRVEKAKDPKGRSTLHPKEKFALLIVAWNAYVLGREVRSLVWRGSDENFPTILDWYEHND